MKYQDSYGNWSEWSEETFFTTIDTSPPNLPDNISPANEAAEIGLKPTIQSSAFSDPDAGDTHTASRWQIRISTGDYASPVFDSGVDSTNLTEIAVPSNILSPNATYYWHVMYRDSYGNWSAYSPETSFDTITMPAPIAVFSTDAVEDEVEMGQPVNFTEQSEGEIDSWIWDFGDGAFLEWNIISRPRDGKFIYTYAAAGTYTISLTVSNLAGSDIKTTEIIVYVAPQASFSAPAQAIQGQSVTFTGLSVGDITTWEWDFDDGTTQEWNVNTRPDDGKLTHTYAAEGTYRVSLKVTGPRGSNSESKTIELLAPESTGGFEFSTWMIGAIAGAVIVIGGVIYLALRRRARRRQLEAFDKM
jgi:PKD repeat protein